MSRTDANGVTHSWRCMDATITAIGENNEITLHGEPNTPADKLTPTTEAEALEWLVNGNQDCYHDCKSDELLNPPAPVVEADLYIRKIETRRATVVLQVTSDRMVHAFALLKSGRYVDRTVEGYDGPSWTDGQAEANRLLASFR